MSELMKDRDRNKRELCSFAEIYARSERIMLVRGELCSFGENYARSRRIMLVRGDLCSFAEIYARLQKNPSPLIATYR